MRTLCISATRLGSSLRAIRAGGKIGQQVLQQLTVSRALYSAIEDLSQMALEGLGQGTLGGNCFAD